jgi:hypothetical protein
MITTAIRPTIRPYSTAVAPFSSFCSRCCVTATRLAIVA